MSYVIRLQNTGQYLTRKGMNDRWNDDIGRARLFSKPGDAKYTIEQGDASAIRRYSVTQKMVETGEITLPVIIEVVEVVMSAGEIADRYTYDNIPLHRVP